MADQLALAKTITAVQMRGTLFLLAEGFSPTPCDSVSWERSPLTVEPPAFLLIQHHNADPGHVCSDRVVPFKARAHYQFGRDLDMIIVRDAAGDHRVEVKQVRAPPHPQLAFGGGGQPDPLAVDGSEGNVREAAGYSSSYSLEEAIHDAMKNLPPGPPPKVADYLAYFQIVSIGLKIGGIAGLNHLKVVIRTVDPK